MVPDHLDIPSATASTPTAPRRSERARKAILLATIDLVSTVGYAGLTIEGIALAAGVGKQTIYRWWPSKAAVLFDAILEKSSQPEGDVSLPDTGDLETDLRQVLRATVAELIDPENDRLQRAVTVEIQTDTVIAQELVRRLLRPQLDATAARIEAGIRAGQIDASVNAELVAELLFGPIFYRWLLRTGEVTQAFADGVLDLVLGGIRSPGPGDKSASRDEPQ